MSEAESRRVEMLEALAWGEHLILYQDQRAAALRIILAAWIRNPLSLKPARVALRRLMPQPLVSGIVYAMRAIRSLR